MRQILQRPEQGQTTLQALGLTPSQMEDEILSSLPSLPSLENPAGDIGALPDARN